MTTLTIRNIDPQVQRRLRIRAAEHGRSMEAEVRQIVSDAVGTEAETSKPEEVNLAEAIRRIFAPFGGVELELPPRGPNRPPPDFGE
ncbi:MAG: Arc family DNA-binding protein [Stellaceae bacterium]